MSTHATDFTRGVPDEWLEDHLATVFSRWHGHITSMQGNSQRLLIEEAGIQRNDTVMDIACGSGIPSLKIAETVGPIGRVVAVDPSPIFLAAVAENARAARLNNVQTVQGGAEHLPFEAGSFDAATCHMGVMFFLNLNAGLTAIRQVLRPGKRAGFAAWGAIEKNTYFGSLFPVLMAHTPPPPAPPADVNPEDMPQPMRFAAPGSLSRALAAAGYQDVRERAEQVELVWPGPASSAVDMFLELSRLMERIPAEQQDAVRQEFLAAVAPYDAGEKMRFSAEIVIASGAA